MKPNCRAAPDVGQGRCLSESAEAHRPAFSGTQINVGQFRNRNDDPAALVIGKFKGRVAGEGLVQDRDDLVGGAGVRT